MARNTIRTGESASRQAIAAQLGIAKEEAWTLLDTLEAEGFIRKIERKDAKSTPYTAYESS